MKILFLSRRFYSDIGGVEKHVLEIGKRLALEGHEISIVTQSQGKERKIEGIEIFRLPKTSSKKVIWKWFWKNRNLIRRADIIHAHDVYFWYFPFRILFPLKKSFVTFHGYESYPIKKKAIMVRKLSEYLANGNIIVGDFIKKWYGTKPDYVTYGGVEISNLPAGKAGIKYPSISAGRKISNKIKPESAIFIGRLDEQTGILEYAKTADLIKKKYPEFEFKIVGDGIFRNRLKKYKPLGFKKNSSEYLNQYNFAFVSRYLSILEALAHKRLVFALYDNPVKEDYLRLSPFAKFIIIENSPEKIAEKVKYYLDHENEEKAMIGKGFEWAQSQTWNDVAKVYLRLWRRK